MLRGGTVHLPRYYYEHTRDAYSGVISTLNPQTWLVLKIAKPCDQATLNLSGGVTAASFT